VAKFRAWSGPTLPANRQDQIIALVGEIDSLRDVSELAALLGA
jgi:hypothetical protein